MPPLENEVLSRSSSMQSLEKQQDAGDSKKALSAHDSRGMTETETETEGNDYDVAPSIAPAQPQEEEEKEEAQPPPTPLRSVKDFADPSDLGQVLLRDVVDHANAGILADWTLAKYDVPTTVPQTAAGESERLWTLRSYDILESDVQEPEFQDLTQEACRVFDVPIAVVSLVDLGRQWFKSIQGLEGVPETPRCLAFCAHVVQRKSKRGVLVVPDATLDDRFKDHPLVVGGPQIRFYAGAPLKSPEGHVLGTCCIIDTKPHPEGLSFAQQERLISMSEQAVYAMITRLED